MESVAVGKGVFKVRYAAARGARLSKGVAGTSVKAVNCCRLDVNISGTHRIRTSPKVHTSATVRSTRTRPETIAALGGLLGPIDLLSILSDRDRFRKMATSLALRHSRDLTLTISDSLPSRLASETAWGYS